jgi:hypothetical protein
MADRVIRWLGTEEAGASIGMSAQWVRQQIEAGRLSAYVFSTGGRRTYRIRTDDWSRFLVRYRRRTDDPDWD